MNNNLISAVIAAIEDMGAYNRYTPFSDWYKGDHKRAQVTLSKALRALAKHLRTSKEDPELLEATKSFLDRFMAKNGMGNGYKAMLKARFRISMYQQEAQAVVQSGKCPCCGSKVKRNLAIAGWWQCEQYGAPGFRARDNEPSCSWQGFTC